MGKAEIEAVVKYTPAQRAINLGKDLGKAEIGIQSFRRQNSSCFALCLLMEGTHQWLLCCSCVLRIRCACGSIKEKPCSARSGMHVSCFSACTCECYLESVYRAVTRSHLVPSWPTTPYVDQAELEFKRSISCLPLQSGVGLKVRMNHYT